MGGAKYQASSSDGIGFSGMTSKAGTRNGLMEVAHWTLLYVDPTGLVPVRKGRPYLVFEGYIDDQEFSRSCSAYR